MQNVVPGRIHDVKADLHRRLDDLLARGCERASSGASVADLEREAGIALVELGQHVVGLLFATVCKHAMSKDLDQRGLDRSQTRVRTDNDGYATVHTTFGPVTFPTFAYRDLSSPLGAVIRAPARTIFPFHRECRSSPLCLEWEARLGARSPFRQAEEEFRFFTRGASTIEDTTIERHMVALSEMVDPSWVYERPEEIRRILVERATRDKKTDRPLIYMSTDAHALRRYVDATWTAQWKMVNGIRVWCEDAVTGKILHLGGEFLWGDCREVAERVRTLMATGVLPNCDDTWRAVNARLVFISDGAEWITEHILPLLDGAEIILDPYHLLEWIAEFGRIVFGVGTDDARELHAQVHALLFGKRPRPPKSGNQLRRGHKKTRGARHAHAYDRPWLYPGRPRTISTEATTTALLDILAAISLDNPEHEKARDALVERLANNALRSDYAVHLARGLQVGSGPMESMHRSGSQQRLKRPGARWLEETSRAVLRFRMLEMSGRWEEFWTRPDIVERIAECFTPRVHPVPSPRDPTLATQVAS